MFRNLVIFIKTVERVDMDLHLDVRIHPPPFLPLLVNEKGKQIKEVPN